MPCCNCPPVPHKGFSVQTFRELNLLAELYSFLIFSDQHTCMSSFKTQGYSRYRLQVGKIQLHDCSFLALLSALEIGFSCIQRPSGNGWHLDKLFRSDRCLPVWALRGLQCCPLWGRPRSAEWGHNCCSQGNEDHTVPTI